MAGGAATTAGVRFQDNVAAWFAVHILAEADASPVAELPASITLEFLLAETIQPTDDLNIGSSAGGRIFVQAKTSLSLSSTEDSELRKVLDQFVRQFVQGCRKPNGQPRPLDISCDRLLLAVSQGAPATIRDGLRSLLGRLRPANAETLPDIVAAMSNSDRAAYNKTRTLFYETWAKHSTEDATDDGFLTFLRLVYVVALDFGSDGASAREVDHLLRTSVLHDPAQATAAWNTLTSFCQDLSPERTGADREYLRQLLSNSGIAIEPPRSYREDIERACEYTAERLAYLRKLSVIRYSDAPEGEIKLQRAAGAELAEMAEGGHLLVIGEPGAGKSGCIHDLAEALADRGDVLVIPVDRLENPSDLMSDLRLERAQTLADLLSNWSGEGAAFLFIDALDAARTRGSLQHLCEDLEDVMRRAPRWRVVTSIREFDLQHSRDAQRLFAGDPHEHFKSSRFTDVRHLQIPLLSDEELGQVRVQAPALGAELDRGGDSLTLLARNLFNLRLLAELVELTTDLAALTSVTTQIELLNLYWELRAEGPGDEAPLRRDLLARTVRAMVGDRQLTASKRSLIQGAANEELCLTQLLSDGVLVETDALVQGADQQVSFAHNILFDYAVARLWLMDLPQTVIEELASADGEDLLLAVRPSLDIAFQRLWYEPPQPDRESFWACTFRFQATRLVGRIIPAGVAAGSFRTIEDLQQLLDAVGQTEQLATSIMGHTITAAIMMDDDPGAEFELCGEQAARWMELASLLASTSLESTAWQIRVLLARAYRGKIRLTSDERRHAGDAARQLLGHALENPKARGTIPVAMHVVCQTVNTNPTDSVSLLSRFLEPNELTTSGHQTLADMTEHFLRLVEADPDFALRLASAAFSTYASRDEQIPIGSRILPLTFNKHDMLDMARHHIADAFPAVMRLNPVVGARIAGRILSEHYTQDHTPGLPERLYEFPFAGGEAVLRPDDSHVWSGRTYMTHQNWWKVLRALYEGLRNVGQESPEQIPATLSCFRESFELAAGWNVLLEAAAESPETLGVAVSELLVVPAILFEDDTRVAAGKLIKSAYKQLADPQRCAIEETIMCLTDELPAELSEEYRAHCRDRILGCIPRELVATDPAKQRLDEMDVADAVPSNKARSSGGAGRVSKDELLVEQGVDIAAPQNQTIRKLTQAVKDCKPADQSQSLSATQITDFFPTLEQLNEQVAAASDLSIDQQLVESAREYLIECCERMAQAEDLTPEHRAYPFIRRTLLAAASDPKPEHSPEDDEQWNSDMPSWSSPAPRISAAIGLMALANKPATIDDEIRQAIQTLCTDPHPAVRYQIARRCLLLWKTDRSLMWELIVHYARHEPSLGILTFFIDDVLLRFGRDETERAERLLCQVYRRTRRDSRASKVRELCAVLFFRRALWDQDVRNERRLRVFASGPLHFAPELSRLVFLCRELLVMDNEEQSDEENARVRSRSVVFLRDALRSIMREVRAIRALHGPEDEWSEEDIASFRTLHSLAHSIGNQVYFASGAFDERQGREDSLTLEQLSRYAQEADPLLDLLCEVEFVDIAYDVLKTLQHLAPTRPTRIFELVGKLVTHATQDGIQYESMATDLVVEIVEQYLADRRELFRDNRALRDTLLDVLDVFVEAGWPKATQLTFRLSEVFR